MSWMNSIISWLKSTELYFYNAYLEVLGWVYPFWLLSYPLLYASRSFGWLAYYFSLFNNWLVWANKEIGKILSIEAITSYFQTWINYATWAWDWVTNAWNNVVSIVDIWWSSVQLTVQVWIEDAKQWTKAQLDSLEDTLAYILVWWDEFKDKIPSIDEILYLLRDWWDKTLANIISWGALTGIQISTLMDSKIRDWLPFYDELAALWGDIKLFFTDPLQWLYDKAEEFFERFW